MNDKPTNTEKTRAIRSMCMEWAVRSNCGNVSDNESRILTDPDKILNAARKFEAYIKGEDVPLKAEITIVDNKGDNW